MDKSSTLGVLSLFLASILTITITGFMEMNLSGFELNLKIDDFQKTKNSKIDLTKDNQKPSQDNLQGQSGID